MKNLIRVLILVSVNISLCWGMAKNKIEVKPAKEVPSLQELCARVVMKPEIFRSYEKELVRSDGKYNFSTKYSACLPVQFKQAKTIREICCSICAAYELAQESIVSKGIDKLLMMTPVLCSQEVDLSQSFFVLSDRLISIDMSGKVMKNFADRLKLKVQQDIKNDTNIDQNLKAKLLGQELEFEENLWILSFCLQGDSFSDTEIVDSCFAKVDDKKKNFKPEVQQLLNEKMTAIRTKIPAYQWSLNHCRNIKKLNPSTGDN